jgi:serine/threonine-protein kinase
VGVVYEATDRRLGRPAAVKLLPGRLCSDDQTRRDRFRTEAAAVARLDHPNVVRVYEAGEAAGVPYMALELAPGGSLADRLAAGPLAVADAVAVVRAAAAAVQHAHDRGVLHRDLKPANVLFAADGTPKVADFGLARLGDADARLTDTGVVGGTPGYLAPELAAGGLAQASRAADVYALGAVLYECLTGRPPADGPTFWEALRRAVEHDPVPPSDLRADLPPGLDTVCRVALAKSPADRYPSAAAFIADLDRVSAGQRVQARPPRRRSGRPRRPVRLAGVAVALLLAGGLAAGWALRPDDRLRDAADDARVGHELLARGAYPEAGAVFARGQRLAAGRGGPLADDLDRGLRAARRGAAADELHHLVDRLRFEVGSDTPADDRPAVAAECERMWTARGHLTADDAGLGADHEARLRDDLLDLALLSADLLARAGGDPTAALTRLNEAEQTLGRSAAVDRVKRTAAGGAAEPPDAGAASAWEGYTYGRLLLARGEWVAAAGWLRPTADRRAGDPAGFWPNFHLGVCEYRRGRVDEAVARFSAALAVAPSGRAVWTCLYNRGLAYAAAATTEKREAAARDFGLALEANPGLAAAALNRGLVRLRLGHPPAEVAADADLAERLGHPPAGVLYLRAELAEATGDRDRAVRLAAAAADRDPGLTAARQLVDRLSRTADRPPRGGADE